MSWFKSYFSPATKQKEEDLLGAEVATPEQIVQTLKLKRMKQMQQAKKLETQAKQAYANGDKQTAVAILKQKPVIDTQLRQLSGQIANMEHQQIAYDNAATSAQMARVMRTNAQQMRTLVESVDTDDIHEVADDLSDLTQQSFEMGDALAAPLGGYLPYDAEDNIERQLAEWSHTPAVPSVDKEKEEDDDILARLEQLQVSDGQPSRNKITT